MNLFAENDQETVNGVVNACTFATNELGRAGASKQDRIHATLVALKITGTEVEDQLENLEDEWPDVSTDIGGTRFQEVSEHYV